jgi:tetratricopeptide (TPR) repeat protein
MPAHRSRSAATFAFAIAVSCALMAAPAPAAAQDHHHHHGHAGDEVGVVAFDVRCAPGVRDDFDHAVALMHHMMYQQARQAFEAIAEADASCAMAHWGIATALFQPLWPGRPDADVRQAGWEAIEWARELGPATERERALVEATAAFWRDPASEEWWPRVRRWHAALAEAHRQQPDDKETAAFYALSLMAMGQAEGDVPAHYARAADLLREIHEREPLHPGAIHYTIHADDISGREAESLDIVRLYDRIAPHVPHALHMPSHIFVRLGDWPGTIDWNRRSADAALDFPANDRLSLHYPHALDYLLYAHLQKGDDARSRQVLDEALTRDERYEENFVSAFHLAVMPARFAVERRDWHAAAALEPRSPAYLAWDRYWWPEALSWFARGLGAVHTGDLDTARQAERRMIALRDRARDADETGFATYIEVDRLILNGWIAHATGEADAEARLREAARLEGTVEKHVVTPGALLPPNEALGDLLMAQDRPGDALASYERSLEIWPNRYNSLLGAARAARAADDPARARVHYAALLEVVGASGSERDGVREARDFGR